MAILEYDASIDFNQALDIVNLLPPWRSTINEVHHFKTNNLIEIVFTVAAKSETEIQQWLSDYEEMSKCSYSIRSTEKCLGSKVKFKQRLHCQHNTGNSNIYDPLMRNRTRNSNCPSTISITLKTVKKRYQGKDKSKAPNPEMPCEIKLIPNHNHSTPDYLRFRQVSKETKQTLINLFESGHSPTTALECLKMNIQMKYENFHEILADRSLCPDYMYCYHLYMKINKHGPLEVSQEFLKKKIEEFNQDNNNINSSRIKFIDKDYVICLCPPLIQRVHETIKEASEIVFMDSTGTVDHDGNRIFLLLTVTECGGLPLAILITSSESCHLISVGFQLLKEIMGNRIFYGTVDGPTLFMTNDSAAEQAAIKSEWPKSVNLLCIFHTLQSIWKWLINANHGIKQEHQQKLFQEFRNIMYANNEKDCNVAFEIAQVGSERYPEYQAYLKKYWEQRILWALCYRNDLRPDHNANKAPEAAMRLLKEKMFDSIKAFNLIQVIDFMMTTFVYYYERTLLDAAHNRTRENILHLLTSSPPADVIERTQHLLNDIYLVPSEKDSNLLYIVNTEVLMCTCNQGRTGYMCKHIFWICGSVGSEKFMKSIDNKETRETYLFIATGNQPATNCLKSSQSNEIKETFTKIDLHNIESLDEPDVDMLRSKEDDQQFISSGGEIINEINEQFSQYLKRSPFEVATALDVFNKQLKKIKTVSEFTTACHTFSLGSIRKSQRSRNPVQPNVVARHKTNLSGKNS